MNENTRRSTLLEFVVNEYNNSLANGETTHVEILVNAANLAVSQVRESYGISAEDSQHPFAYDRVVTNAVIEDLFAVYTGEHAFGRFREQGPHSYIPIVDLELRRGGVGFKEEFQDRSDQVTHFVAAMWGDNRWGAAGRLWGNLSNPWSKEPADRALNIAAFGIIDVLDDQSIDRLGSMIAEELFEEPETPFRLLAPLQSPRPVSRNPNSGDIADTPPPAPYAPPDRGTTDTNDGGGNDDGSNSIDTTVTGPSTDTGSEPVITGETYTHDGVEYDDVWDAAVATGNHVTSDGQLMETGGNDHGVSPNPDGTPIHLPTVTRNHKGPVVGNSMSRRRYLHRIQPQFELSAFAGRLRPRHALVKRGPPWHIAVTPPKEQRHGLYPRHLEHQLGPSAQGACGKVAVG